MSVQKLIIADRDPTLVENLAEHFRRRGVEVKTAYDALTVLKLVHRDVPDAFVLGVDMPCDNGLSVCELLSDERRFAFLPTILLTEHADAWLTHQCHDLQAYYAAKGPELARRLETLLEEAATHVPATMSN
jgi:DNA-binding response OmpR family regulator